MTPDEALTAALREAAAHAPTTSAPTAAVMRRGKAIRRRHRVTRSAVLVAALLVPVAGAATLSLRPPGSDSAPAVPAVPPASSEVTVVDPGERIPLAGHHAMWLTDQGVFLEVPTAGRAEVRLTKASEVPGGTISTSVSADASGTLWTGVYRGPGAPARVTVSVDGRSMDARVVTLSGAPGWVAFHADDAHAGATSRSGVTITVRATDGTVLASLTKKPRS
ncbi:hypothetical protein ACF07V_31520 [Streptomyces sp. NPDC015661]|uniref:hypothetical protein n=1 Tax=Streptomyces sp. NPDC015661 TaxID=3364961 RepID=UPI0036FD5AFB